MTSFFEGTVVESFATSLLNAEQDLVAHKPHGRQPLWDKNRLSLPSGAGRTTYFDNPAVTIGERGELPPELEHVLRSALETLIPWRKGPFSIFGNTIDTEWRSDWKWNRLLPGLMSLKGKRVLDVGCGSGYHCWRMLGAGAAEVVGIDPTPLFVLQFRAMQRYLAMPDIFVLPLGLEQVPAGLRAFDTVFSMGILYHRRSPFDHLQELRDTLCSGGQLILETLVVDGGKNTVFTPPGRYARMGNVWCLPSVPTLMGWLEKIGFKQPELIDCTKTTTQEQRSTDWMTFHSLEQFLDPDNHDLTFEGHPAPQRAIISAEAP